MNVLRTAVACLSLVITVFFSSFNAHSAQLQLGTPYLIDIKFQQCLNEVVQINGWTTTEEVTELICPKRGIKDVIGIETFINLNKLDLSDNKLVSVSPLQSLNKIIELSLTGNVNIDPFDVASVIQNKPELTHLGVGGISLGGDLSWLPIAGPQGEYDLIELDISGIGEVYDLYPLIQYPNLKILNVSDNNLFEVYPIANFLQLEELDISDNQLNDIAWLSYINNLKKLNISGNKSVYGTAWIDSYTINSIISANPMLTHLGLADIAIGDLNQLYALTELTTSLAMLDISNTGVAELSLLSSFTNLNTLIANDNLISNVFGLEQVPLQVLKLGRNKIISTSGFEQMSLLQDLDLSDNKIIDVFQLQFLNNLNKINLTGNKSLNYFDISHIVYANPNLTHINVGGIYLGNLNWLPPFGIAGEYDIQEINISNTGISELQSLAQYSNLHTIKTAGNNIQFIFGVDQLSNLEVLDLSDNKLFDINSLQFLSNLTQLDLSGNVALSSFEVINVIQNNPGLQRLGVADIKMGDDLYWLPMGGGGDYNFTELDISRTGSFFDLTHVTQYANLRVLKAAGNQLSWIWYPGSLQNLEILDLSHNVFDDMSPLQSLRNLRQLNISYNKRLGFLPPLDVFEVNPIILSNPELTHLGLAGVAISDLNTLEIFYPFSNNIIELDISNTNVYDLSRLGVLPKLEVLKANNNLIIDIFGLEQLPLRILELSNNKITNVGSLDFKQSLEALDLSDNQLIDITTLLSLSKLEKLNLSGNSQLSAPNVQSVIYSNSALTHIGVNGIDMGNLNWLPSPTPQGQYNLEELNISNIGVFPDLSPVSQYVNLKVLRASGNQVQVPGPLDTLTQLEVIDLSNNQLFDVTALHAYRNLIKFNVSGNTLLQKENVLPIIQANTNLTHIGIKGINMGDLYWLPAGYNLVELNISNTGDLFDIYPLLQQPSLKVLKIAGNNLWDVWPIDQLVNLETLDLSNNDLLYVLPLTNLFNVLSIDLQGNNSIQCNELDALDNYMQTKLPVGVLIRPANCALFTPPDISILNPIDASKHYDSSSINFVAITNDLEDGNIDSFVQWESNIDGVIGSGGTLNKSLSVGAHTVTASVTDSHGNTKVNSITLNILKNTAPQITIYSIQDGAVFGQSEIVSLAADAFDNEEGEISQKIEWSSNKDGLLGLGSNVQISLSVGAHVVTASVTDDAGANSIQTVSITINGFPKLVIQSPTTNSLYQQNTSVSFIATASDNEDGDIAANVIWVSDVDGLVGVGANVQKILSIGNHIVSASISDSLGKEIIKTIFVQINGAPSLTIQSPISSSITNEGSTIMFTASASDIEDGDLSENIIWASSIDGVLGNGGSIQKILTVGDHAITANIIDTNGAGYAETINVSVNANPQLSLQSPLSGAVYQQNRTIDFVANASDIEDGNLSLSVTWSSNVDGVLGKGASISRVLSVGNHIITAAVSDSRGVTTTQISTVIINTAPVISLQTPSSGSLYMLQEMIELKASASDVEDGVISANVKWSSNIDGVLGIGSMLSKSLSLGSHTITASVIDSLGASKSITTDVVIDQIKLDLFVKSRGSRKKAILTWSGSRTDVDIYRNNVVIDDGDSSDTEDYRFRDQAIFKVCERNTINCSVDVLAE